MTEPKDLDTWINHKVKVNLSGDGNYYSGILIEEQKNGLLVKAEKRIYIPYESILSLEEL